MKASARPHDHDPEALASAPGVIETEWGYVVRSAPRRARPMRGDFLLRLVSAAFLAASAAQWVLPGSMLAGEALSMKIAVSLALGCSGLVLMLRRGYGASWRWTCRAASCA